MNKKLGIFAGTSISVVVGAIYGLLSLTTGEINPITAIRVENERRENVERLKEEYIHKLFGPNGYSNRDGRPGLSPEEQSDVYKRMGLGLFIEGQTRFPYDPNRTGRPSLQQLERAVKSYEAEISNSNKS